MSFRQIGIPARTVIGRMKLGKSGSLLGLEPGGAQTAEVGNLIEGARPAGLEKMTGAVFAPASCNREDQPSPRRGGVASRPVMRLVIGGMGKPGHFVPREGALAPRSSGFPMLLVVGGREHRYATEP